MTDETVTNIDKQRLLNFLKFGIASDDDVKKLSSEDQLHYHASMFGAAVADLKEKNNEKES